MTGFTGVVNVPCISQSAYSAECGPVSRSWIAAATITFPNADMPLGSLAIID
jgi:hypothetical protein